MLFEVELLNEYKSSDTIDGLNSRKRFLKDYPNAKNKHCFLDTFYKDEVTRIVHLPFNRKVEIRYTLEYRDGIPNSILFDDLGYYQLDIKVYKMEDSYKNVRNVKFKNELELLKEKYNIKDYNGQ